MRSRIADNTFIRYIFVGTLVFSINLATAWFFFAHEYFVSSPSAKNLGNLLSLHIALFISYPLHKTITWGEKLENFFTKFIKFYLISLGGVVLRTGSFAFFVFLEWHWLVATILSIVLVILFNFVGFDNFVFRKLAPITSDIQEKIYQNQGHGAKILETIEDATAYNNWIADKIRPYLGEKNLELGAGKGTITNLIIQDYPVYITELAEDNLEILRLRFADHQNTLDIVKDIHSIPSSSMKPAKGLDAVYSSNVLEHIEDDLGVLQKAMELLKPGGHFIAFVPAMMALYADMDQSLGHYRRYTAKDQKRINEYLTQNNIDFEWKQFRFLNPIGALGWFIKMRVLKAKTIRKSDAMVMNSLIKIFSLFDFIPFPFGQSIFFVLQKK